MAISFAKPFYEIIADVSTRPEYQTAVIRIEDSSLVETDYDVETGETTVVGDPVIYPVGAEDGRARIIGVRWGVYTGGESQANATTVSAIRIQLPRDVAIRVKRGCKVYVQSAPNPVLQGYVFTVTSDMQGSSNAARTIEAALDLDSIRAVTGPAYTVAGTPMAGETLLAGTTGEWVPGTVELSYQWFRVTDSGTTAIPGADEETFTVPSGWAGSTVYALVTGSAEWFGPTTVRSEGVEIV